MTAISTNSSMRTLRLAPDLVDQGLAAGATLVLLAIVAALARGRAGWSMIPWPIWAHLASIGVALALTPVMLLRRRGDRSHKILGRVWIAAMMATALISFDIRGLRGGGLSPIHVLSIVVLVAAPLAGWRAARHDIRGHRIAIRSMIAGALLIAGLFTFPFGRLLGRWLFG